MEEKIFNLLEKMYTEMNDMRNDMNEMRKDIQNNTVQINDVQSNIVRLVNDLTPKVKALFDGYIQNTNLLNRIEDKVDHLTKRVEKQEIEIKVIKSTN